MENNCKYTEFGLKVKMKLLQEGKTLVWLHEKVTERTGLFVDGPYMYKILSGQRNAPKIAKAIGEILNLDIPSDGEEQEDDLR